MNAPHAARTTLLLAAAGLAGQGRAQTLSWNNAIGGAASVPGNWSPAGVPGAATPLNFALSAVYPVTFNAASARSASMNFTRGQVSLTMTSAHRSGTVSIGNGVATTGSATLVSGTWQTSAFTLGQTFGSAGTLGVSGEDSLLECGAFSIAQSTNLLCTASVTGAAQVICGNVVLGNNNTLGQGRLTVSGQTQFLPPLRSRLDATGSITVGVNGVGSLTVADGALVSCTQDVVVAQNLSNPGPVFSEGTLTVGGAGIRLPATLNVGGSLKIGRGPTPGSDTGHGAATINADGVVTVAGPTLIGGTGQGSGALTVNEGARLTTAGLAVGTSGAFTHNGGVVTVASGPFLPSNTAQLRVSGAADIGLVLDSIPNAMTFTAASNSADAILLGSGGVGDLTLRGGTRLTVGAGDLRLGDGAGSIGRLTLETGASLSAPSNGLPGASGEVVLGDEGIGSLAIRSGATMACHSIFVGGAPSSSHGVLVVDGPGSTLSAAALSIANGDGAGSVSIENGATVSTSGGFAFQVSLASDGTMVIRDSTLNATTAVRIAGRFTMANSTINAAEFILNTNAAASGVIHARIRQDSLHTLSAGGDLSLGDGSVHAYQGVPLLVGNFHVVIDDPASATLGDTSLSGGTLTGTHGFSLPFAKTLSGTGTVEGSVGNAGAIVATGAEGLTFAGSVSGLGQGITGTRIAFAPTGGLFGAGTISAAVVAQAGSILTFTGPSAIGNGMPSGFTCDGTLNVLGDLTVNDSSGFNLGPSTTLRNATLRCTPGITVPAGVEPGRLVGAGTLDGQVVNLGVIAPGIAGTDDTTQLTVAGPYTQERSGISGTLEIDLEGPGPGQADRLVVQGTATLRGRINLNLIHGFQPANGLTQTLVLASSIAGHFDLENLPPRFHLVYTPTEVQAVFCASDFNNDGFVDFFDYDDFVACFETGQCPPGSDADFNQDGFADFFDYDDFVLTFEQGC